MQSATRQKRKKRLLLTLAVGMLAAVGLGTATGTLAMFTDQQTDVGAIAAGHIFPGVRTSSAFDVRDASGGGPEADRSSPFAFPSDGRTVTTGAWDTAFASGRYLQFDLNAPLAAVVAASSVDLQLRFSSASPSGTTCAYVEVRRISDDGLLATYGSGGSPLACVTGTGLTSFSLSLPIITSTDSANDLRVRVYGDDSAAAGSVVDEATVTGSTPYQSFTLYPVRYTDAATGTPITVPWELQGP
jgi:predicted ribosomally synthesized peptide with SipW-like signal peptide